MDDMTDFEELIDLNIYFLSESQKSTGPLNDVLDKMCEAMDENNLAMDSSEVSNELKVRHENVNELECISADECLGNDSVDIEHNCSNTSTYEQKYANNRTNEIIANGVIEEFESILAAKCLVNGYMKDKTNEITSSNRNEVNEIVSKEEVIDLEEFEDILSTNCFGTDCIEDESGTSDIGNKNHHKDKNGFGGQTVSNDDLDESKVILAAEYLENSNLEEKIGKDDNTITRSDEVIDSDEFISCNLYLDKYCTETDNCKSINTNLGQKYDINNVVPYEVPVELEVESNIKLAATRYIHTEICEENDIDSDDGYVSSDFEFITEDEASKVGLITKFDIVENNTQNSSVQFGIITSNISNDNIGLTNSLSNEASPLDYIKYSKYRYQRCYAQLSSEHHVIPEGERYLDMFRGQYAPIVLNNLLSMGNKKCVHSGLMNAGTEDPGANLLFCAPEEDEHYKKYKGDADECRKKILAIYPADNKRKKRRF